MPCSFVNLDRPNNGLISPGLLYSVPAHLRDHLTIWPIRSDAVVIGGVRDSAQQRCGVEQGGLTTLMELYESLGCLPSFGR